jgi:ABC-type branched-subunit amino acid transport system ATPase component/branched-subunit amino acid ABC-type transport system permease component
MDDLLGYAFVSIPLIGAFAMFAVGITAIYRASRVLNLAHGAMAMVPAYVTHGLNAGWRVPLALALPMGVASGALLGVVVERAFVRRLRPQGPTAQTVGTVAVTGLLVAITAKVAGTASVLPPKIFPEGAVTVGGASVTYGALGLFAVGAVSSAGMYAFFRYTEYGLAMRGAAQNRTAATLVGVDPDRAAAAAWAIGGGLAALAGILLAAVTSLDPYTLSLQVLPAFVAGLIGGLESLIGAMVGSVIVGLTFGLVPALGQLPGVGGLFRNAGAPQLVLTLAALVVMVARGRRVAGVEEAGAGLATAGTFRRMEPRRFDRRMALLALAVVLVPLAAPFSIQGTLLTGLRFMLIAASLVLLIGWVGQISLAQASFVGIGALTAGLLARDAGIGFPFDLIAGALAGMAAAVALGSVALRVRGLYLAVATLIFAWMGDAFLFRSEALGIAGGSSAIPNQHIGTPGAIPSFDLTSRAILFVVFVPIVTAALLALTNLRDTRTGRAFFAVRGSEMAAASLGIDVTRMKLVAFAVSGLLAGLAGGLMMTASRVVVPQDFFFTVSLQYLAIAVVGGLASIGGAIAAALLFAGLDELFFRVAALAGWLEIVSAGLLAVVLLAYPGGLAALPTALQRATDPVQARWARRRAERRQRRADRHAARHTSGPADTDTDPAADRGATGDWLAELDSDQAPATASSNGHEPPPARTPEPTTPAAPADMAAPGPASVNGHRRRVRVPLDRARTSGGVPLEVAGVTVAFGGLTAVDDVSLNVRTAEVVGLIGPNGAGKTTLFNAILGLNDPAAGTVHILGQDATTLPPHLRARLGVARTFQVLQLFNELTVADNLLVATHLHDPSGLLSNLVAGPATLAAEVSNRRRVDRVLELLRLRDIADEPVTELPFGTLRMVELGRALVTGSKLLMLDENASGLNDTETERLVQVVRDVRALGVSVLLIEHDIRMVTSVSDYVYVLDRGALIAEGTPQAVRRDPRVIEAYLGTGASSGADDHHPTPATASEGT